MTAIMELPAVDRKRQLAELAEAKAAAATAGEAEQAEVAKLEGDLRDLGRRVHQARQAAEQARADAYRRVRATQSALERSAPKELLAKFDLALRRHEAEVRQGEPEREIDYRDPGAHRLWDAYNARLARIAEARE